MKTKKKRSSKRKTKKVDTTTLWFGHQTGKFIKKDVEVVFNGTIYYICYPLVEEEYGVLTQMFIKQEDFERDYLKVTNENYEALELLYE